MKLILVAILLFTLGFFGTGFAIHPDSPFNLLKVLSPEETVGEDKENEEQIIDNNPDDVKTADEDTEDKNNNKQNTQEPTKNKVTKRPADLSKPIVLSSEFKQITSANLTSFLADKNPNVVIVGNFGKSADPDLVDSLNLLLEQFPIKNNIYIIDTESTDLPIDRGALTIDENLRMSISPAIYYQKAAQIYYHRSLKLAEYGDLYEFFERIYSQPK